MTSSSSTPNQLSANPYAWLQADALEVAPRLLGWELISRAGTSATAAGPASPDATEPGGLIVEVEAYHGLQDPASHAYRGLTPRTAPMFEAGGTVYVYLSYGLHICLNIVTGPAGEASAVLIRALEPTRGLEAMAARRGTANPRRLATGPGNVGQALGLTVSLSGSRLGQTLSLQPPAIPIPAAHIATSPRIGVTRAANYPGRFYLHGNPFVSRYNERTNQKS